MFGYISQLFVVFLLLTLKKWMLAGRLSNHYWDFISLNFLALQWKYSNFWKYFTGDVPLSKFVHFSISRTSKILDTWSYFLTVITQVKICDNTAQFFCTYIFKVTTRKTMTAACKKRQGKPRQSMCCYYGILLIK